MIEFQYFSGCPHAKDTLQNLREVLSETGFAENDLHIVDVSGPEAAKQINFQGSPTILVNGIDIYSGTRPEGYSYSCRVYDFDDRHTGVIPKEFIRNKLDVINL